MDLYTLTDTFLPDQPVDSYASAIWTERYSAAGDVELVTSPTPENIALLAEGTFLAEMSTDEVMQITTQKIEEKQLKVGRPSSSSSTSVGSGSPIRPLGKSPSSRTTPTQLVHPQHSLLMW